MVAQRDTPDPRMQIRPDPGMDPWTWTQTQERKQIQEHKYAQT